MQFLCFHTKENKTSYFSQKKDFQKRKSKMSFLQLVAKSFLCVFLFKIIIILSIMQSRHMFLTQKKIKNQNVCFLCQTRNFFSIFLRYQILDLFKKGKNTKVLSNNQKKFLLEMVPSKVKFYD